MSNLDWIDHLSKKIQNPGVPRWGHPTVFSRFNSHIFLLLLFWHSKDELNLSSCDRTLPFWGMYDRMRVYPKNALAASFHTCTPQPPRLKLCQSCWKARCFWSVQTTLKIREKTTPHTSVLSNDSLSTEKRERKNQSELSGSATQVTSNLSNHHQKESIAETI